MRELRKQYVATFSPLTDRKKRLKRSVSGEKRNLNIGMTFMAEKPVRQIEISSEIRNINNTSPRNLKNNNVIDKHKLKIINLNG
ncbi:MAG TPA: hypothetical protein DEF07_00390 [Nitrosomonas sp.]|nr:hypothetical protein [Nitrosomonas sp.]